MRKKTFWNEWGGGITSIGILAVISVGYGFVSYGYDHSLDDELPKSERIIKQINEMKIDNIFNSLFNEKQAVAPVRYGDEIIKVVINKDDVVGKWLIRRSCEITPEKSFLFPDINIYCDLAIAIKTKNNGYAIISYDYRDSMPLTEKASLEGRNNRRLESGILGDVKILKSNDVDDSMMIQNLGKLKGNTDPKEMADFVKELEVNKFFQFKQL